MLEPSALIEAASHTASEAPAQMAPSRDAAWGEAVGPLSPGVPSFPVVALAVQPLRLKAESQGSADFTALCAGQTAALGRSYRRRWRAVTGSSAAASNRDDKVRRSTAG
jgi:hypothetical protein